VAGNNFLDLLKLVKAKKSSGVTIDNTFDELYPRPFSKKIHVVAFIIGVWGFLMMIVLLFTM
jgi:hypothetical protein